MADHNHVKIALQGAEAISEWREQNPNTNFDLSHSDLRRAQLQHSNLQDCNLSDAVLQWADLRWADLMGCNLTGANLTRADFHKADLENATMDKVDLSYANLEDANLTNVSLISAIFSRTRLFNTNLSVAKGLETCHHTDISFVDQETLSWSEHIPDEFLRGIGTYSAFPAKVYRVAVGSPSDVMAERERARMSTYEWNDTNSRTKRAVLLPVMWEHHATPELGDHPQRILNERLLRSSQILIVIFWTRLGTATLDSVSGTVNEIEEFLKEGKPVLVYFCTRPVPQNAMDNEQWPALKQFKSDLQQRGLIEHFETLDELDKKLKQHLTEIVSRLK